LRKKDKDVNVSFCTEMKRSFYIGRIQYSGFSMDRHRDLETTTIIKEVLLLYVIVQLEIAMLAVCTPKFSSVTYNLSESLSSQFPFFSLI
jgi:hypothetical protein